MTLQIPNQARALDARIWELARKVDPLTPEEWAYLEQKEREWELLLGADPMTPDEEIVRIVGGRDA